MKQIDNARSIARAARHAGPFASKTPLVEAIEELSHIAEGLWGDNYELGSDLRRLSASFREALDYYNMELEKATRPNTKMLQCLEERVEAHVLLETYTQTREEVLSFHVRMPSIRYAREAIGYNAVMADVIDRMVQDLAAKLYAKALVELGLRELKPPVSRELGREIGIYI